MKLADVHLKLESKHDAATSWVEASKAFMKVDQRSKCGALSLGSYLVQICHTLLWTTWRDHQRQQQAQGLWTMGARVAF